MADIGVSADGHFNIPEGTTMIVSRPSWQTEGECSWEKWGVDKKAIKTVAIPDSVTAIGNSTFRNCSSLASIAIPDSVTSIGSYAFRNCSSLASIAIPDSVTTIGERAFYGCSSLTSITIPESVITIGRSAFYGCSSLASIAIPDSVTSIGGGAFSGCSALASITIPDSVTAIGNVAFAGCSSLASITIPDSVTSIGGYAFKDCSLLASIAIPDAVAICDDAFYGCSSLSLPQKTFNIPGGITHIESRWWRAWKVMIATVTNITIPDSVTTIEGDAFRDCSSLASITIPDSVTTIGEYAFRDCTSLASITIPESVTAIASHAFAGCSRLKLVIFQGWRTFALFSRSYARPLFTDSNLVTFADAPNSIIKQLGGVCEGITKYKDLPDEMALGPAWERSLWYSDPATDFNKRRRMCAARREMVETVMHIAERLARLAQPTAGAPGQTDATKAAATRRIVPLPNEIWLMIFTFVRHEKAPTYV